MSDLTVAIVLQLLGIVVIIAEIIIPSAGLLSLIALVIFGSSFYLVFTSLSPSLALIFLLADLFVIPTLVIIGLKLLARSPLILKTQLSRAEGVSSQAAELESYRNQTGTALTPLRPAGTAMIMRKRVDVVSRAEFIEKGCQLVVIDVTANQIVVSKKDDFSMPAGESGREEKRADSVND